MNSFPKLRICQARHKATEGHGVFLYQMKCSDGMLDLCLGLQSCRMLNLCLGLQDCRMLNLCLGLQADLTLSTAVIFFKDLNLFKSQVLRCADRGFQN